ncbi:MAG: terpene cyclase/mutase family protein [Planctomycetes bacterium]|nr:terpene cyclase/mutase family protein [Planctomycetota bacterium]
MSSLKRFAAVLAILFVVTAMCIAQDTESGGETGGEGSGGAEADPSEAPALRMLNKNYINEDLKQGVKKGLKRLAELQDANGAFTKGGGQNVSMAVSSMAGLALLASGSTPEKGPYAANIRKVLDYVLSMQDPNSGFITGDNDGSRIHGHGYATLFLAQVYGAVEDENSKKRIENALKLAVKIISLGQTAFGGWGYMPNDLTWDEGSTTVCCIQALRAASDAGITVSKKTIQNAIKYMYDIAEKKVFMHNGEEHVGYTFKYSLSSGWNSDSYALCAAAITTLNGIGVYSEGATWKEHDVGKVYDGGLRWLRFKFDDFIGRRKSGQGSLDVSHFYYAHFYACQAMWNAPEEVYFDEYYPKMRDLLLEEQKRNPSNNGGWPSQSYGEAYTTAYALMILQVPYQLLPLFAR